MTEATVKPALDGLPPEVMELIVPPCSITRGLRVSDNDFEGQYWLALKSKWERGHWSLRNTPQEAIAFLRVLSQTCRSLRAFALKRLWAIVHVCKVEELGRLAEMLKASPSIARHIRHFTFAWDMGGDASRCRIYSKDEGELVDLAFRNRKAMWQELYDKVLVHVSRSTPISRRNYALLESIKYAEPGWGNLDEEGCTSLAAGSHVGGNGPDGNGADGLINGVDKLNACLQEVVSRLCSIETFRWASPVLSMPLPIFETVRTLGTLKALHFELPSARKPTPCSLPYWRIVPALEDLSITVDGSKCRLKEPMDLSSEELAEARALRGKAFENMFYQYELPAGIAIDEEDVQVQHIVHASRTIIAAVKAGHLRKLTYKSRLPFGMTRHTPMTTVFGIRSLLPYWIAIENWNVPKEDQADWTGAASTLRPILAHASLHFGDSITGSTADRRLMQQDVQSLPSRFKIGGVPKLLRASKAVEHIGEDRQPIELYLPWLEEAELALRTANAWNAVVERGEANVVECWCDMCPGDATPPPEHDIDLAQCGMM